jgi:uncharacterized membrane protein YgdD (TMEM256/DUF423 family)
MNPLTLMQKVFLLIAGLSGATNVLLGAMASHWLKDQLNYWELSTFETAARYHMYHTLALFGLAVLMKFYPSKLLSSAGVMFILGIALFSGSLYLMSISEIIYRPSLDMLAPLTPIGGGAFVIGWLLLTMSILSGWKSR